jgi:AbrB family looped-hinge helix DNA binding protein
MMTVHNDYDKNAEEKTDMLKISKLNTSHANVNPKIVEGTSKVSSKGQITIPAQIRSILGVNEGDQLRFIYDNEVLMVEPMKFLSAEELYGIFNAPEDDGQFVLDIHTAREERTEEILNSNWTKKDHM